MLWHTGILCNSVAKVGIHNYLPHHNIMHAYCVCAHVHSCSSLHILGRRKTRLCRLFSWRTKRRSSTTQSPNRPTAFLMTSPSAQWTRATWSLPANRLCMKVLLGLSWREPLKASTPACLPFYCFSPAAWWALANRQVSSPGSVTSSSPDCLLLLYRTPRYCSCTTFI